MNVENDNVANQRTRRTDADNSYWDYGYDSLGQVTSGHKKWPDNSFVSGQQYAYDYDDIGNRERAEVSGQRSDYTANALNQYTQRTVPGAVDILGTAHSNATVTINNQPVARKGEYFAREIGVNNASGAVYTQLTTVAVLKNAGSNQMDIVSSVTGKVFVAKSPELFAYDADGNLTNDGRFAYTWDGENRLISVVAQASLPVSVPRQKVDFQYDHQGRRISKRVYAWETDHWSLITDHRFVYDGWNLLAERSAVSNQLSTVRSYVWGLDLSGTEQGAGGIGGLLYGTLGGSSSTSTVAYAFDGNGNVTGLLNLETGNPGAEYEYSPFGELIRATGPMARENPFRFSTKYQDDETGLLYYGYRYYQPGTGRWLSRDPIGEFDGLQLYALVGNDPVDHTDKLGLLKVCCRTVRYDPATDPSMGRIVYRLFRHCHLAESCAGGEEVYDVWHSNSARRKMDTGTACNCTTMSDVRACLKRHPYSAGSGRWGDNCQTSVVNALNSCCLSTTWVPNCYAGGGKWSFSGTPP